MSGLRGHSARVLPRSRWVTCLAIVAAALGVNAASVTAPHVDIVTQGTIPTEGVPANTHYFHTIQAAVNATKGGDWVLVEPGTYDEAVTVTKPHNDIHIRGINRNRWSWTGRKSWCPAAVTASRSSRRTTSGSKT